MRVVQLFASVLLVAFASASLTTSHRQSKLTSDNFGSYVVTCNETHATFMNFASQGCNGAFTEFSSELNGCGEEFILPLGRNLSWNAVCNATHMQYSNYFNTQCQKPGLLVRTYNLDACYECPNKECKDDVVPPPNRFGPLQRNAPWIENQWHVAPGVLLASSMSSGSVYKIEYNATGDCVSEADCQVKSTPWITGFKSVSGLSYDAQSKTAFALAVAFAPVELNLLISFGLDAPEIYSVIQVAPAPLNLFGNLSLNGLARHDKDKSIFYATNLGNFSGDQGTIVVIDTAVGTWNTFAANLTAADGSFVFNGRLYVSEVFSATVHVFDVSNDTTKLNPVQITSYVAPGLMSLDDFFVTADEDGTATIYGADWVAGRVASWAADGSSNTSSIHAAGLQHPTSVRPELDARGNWQSAYVTVSQGGDYPVVNRQVNGGNVFRLKVRELQPFKAPGSLIQVTCTDSECKDCTATDTMIEQCIPTATGSMYITCGLLNVTVQQYTTSTCSGTSTSTTSGALTCSASGTGSFIQICAKL